MPHRLRERLRERAIRHHRAEVRMTASFGVAALDAPQDLALLIAADKALHAGKMAGRGPLDRCGRPHHGKQPHPPLATGAHGQREASLAPTARPTGRA